MKTSGLKPAVLACIFLFSAAGCSSVDLGQIDETEDPRDDMPGPGIFADENGETALKWSSEKSETPAEAEQPDLSKVDEQAEFEQFKKWNDLRTNAADSAEYQEFLQWLKYQEFKSAQ
jgi:hypothetical protein